MDDYGSMPSKTFLIVLVGCAVMAGCAPTPNLLANTPAPDGTVAGFWLGLWHGFICPVSFVLSLFMDSIHFYEVHNNGGWYNFGFLLGASSVLGGGGASARRK